MVPDGAFATNIKPGNILYEGNSYNTLVVKTFPIKVNEALGLSGLASSSIIILDNRDKIAGLSSGVQNPLFFGAF